MFLRAAAFRADAFAARFLGEEIGAEAVATVAQPAYGAGRDWEALKWAEFNIHRLSGDIPKSYIRRLKKAAKKSEPVRDEPPVWVQEFIEEGDWRIHAAALDMILSRIDSQLRDITETWLRKQLLQRMEDEEESVTMLLLH